MNDMQTYLMDLEHVSPRCSILRLRKWDADLAPIEERGQDNGVGA